MNESLLPDDCLEKETHQYKKKKIISYNGDGGGTGRAYRCKFSENPTECLKYNTENNK